MPAPFNHGRAHRGQGSDPVPPAFIWKVQAADDPLVVGDGLDFLVIPAEFDGMRFTSLHAGIVTVSSSGTPTIQVRNVTDAVDVLSTKIVIDASEFTSFTGAAPVITVANSYLATGDVIAVDVDVAGTGATGLHLFVELT